MVYEQPPPISVANRATKVALASIIVLAGIGFFIGINQGVPRHDDVALFAAETSSVSGATDVLPATDYGEMRRSTKARGRVYGVDELPRQQRDLFAVVEVDLEARRASLATRSERRAYNGAPPVIPHTVDQISNDACLLCHGASFALGENVARDAPHPYYANCTQCHAPPSPQDLPHTMTIANAFDGVAAPFEGERAWIGAPPTIPHSTWMRQNCQACHGPEGWQGMESTHPWRTACLQCHAPSATLDQHAAPVRFLDPPTILPAGAP
jgi:cytochrome c-type protein NapB